MPNECVNFHAFVFRMWGREYVKKGEFMSTAVNHKRLFVLSCVALTVTSMTFALRAGMLGDLGTEWWDPKIL